MSIDQKSLRVVKKAIREDLENKFIEGAKESLGIKPDLTLEGTRAILDVYADIKTRQLTEEQIQAKAREMKLIV